MHSTKYHIKFTQQPWRVLSLTQHWYPLPLCYFGWFDILPIIFWAFCTCTVFIRWLAFKNGDTIFGCRAWKFYFGHQHSHQFARVPILWQTEYFHHRRVRPSYRGYFMHCDIYRWNWFTGTAGGEIFGLTIYTQGKL